MRYPVIRELETEDAGSLISISDMMAGLLFVFIITLAAFIIRFQDAIEVLNDTNESITEIDDVRANILTLIKNELAERGIIVEIDQEHGVLRLKEDAIRFGVGEATLAEAELHNLQIVGEVMADVLPCYARTPLVPNTSFDCDGKSKAKLDSILIEGHTDNVPINNYRYRSNWELSTQRAIETYQVLLASEPEMMALINPQGQMLFSVSGYGDGRPVVEHSVPTPEVENRRIDFRFIMSPPQAVEPQHAVSSRGVR